MKFTEEDIKKNRYIRIQNKNMTKAERLVSEKPMHAEKLRENLRYNRSGTMMEKRPRPTKDIQSIDQLKDSIMNKMKSQSVFSEVDSEFVIDQATLYNDPEAPEEKTEFELDEMRAARQSTNSPTLARSSTILSQLSRRKSVNFVEL